MQQTGTLKKRKRRNLSKVNGLSQVFYDENEDNYTGHDLFGEGAGTSKVCSVRNRSDTRINLNSSQLQQYRREVESGASRHSQNIYGRVTKNPSYHFDNVEEDIGNQTWSRNERSEPFIGLGPFDKRQFVENSVKGRECFLDKYTMQRLKQLIWLGIFTGSFPWKWNSKTNRIEKWGPTMEKIWWIQWFFVTIQTCALTGFQLYSFLHAVRTAETYRTAFQSSFSFLWYSYAVLLNINLYYYKEETRSYINTLMRFNHDYVSKYLIHLDDYEDGGRWVINCAVITNIIQVFISTSFFCSNPFQPWYLFSYIYPKPWYWLIPGAFQEFMVVGQVITSYMLISWMIVAHNNTLNFWLRETHNHNDSDYTIDELRHPKTAIETYRTIQVLSKLFNESVAPMGIPFIKVVMSTAMVPCGYVLIRSMNHLFMEEFPGILTYPFGVIDCATAGWVIMSMPAQVFDLVWFLYNWLGCSFIDSWSRTKQKDLRRVLMSCASLKIWVGRFYFMTLSTTITFFKVIFDIITDCIITFP